MDTTESAATRAKKKYRAKIANEGRYKQINLAFTLPNDQDVYDHLRSRENMAGYIKELIRRDMEG